MSVTEKFAFSALVEWLDIFSSDPHYMCSP